MLSASVSIEMYSQTARVIFRAILFSTHVGGRVKFCTFWEEAAGCMRAGF